MQETALCKGMTSVGAIVYFWARPVGKKKTSWPPVSLLQTPI